MPETFFYHHLRKPSYVIYKHRVIQVEDPWKLLNLFLAKA